MKELYITTLNQIWLQQSANLRKLFVVFSFDDCKHSMKMIYFRTNFDPIQRKIIGDSRIT